MLFQHGVFFIATTSLLAFAPADESEHQYVNSVGAIMRRIPAGNFQMGSPDSDLDAYKSEKPRHQVTISHSFYMGQTEVTQAQWRSVMDTEPWKGMPFSKQGPDYPATFVSWKDATEYCRRLSQKEGREYRLPSEAEWEYACRAGSSTPFTFGADATALKDHAWFEDNASDADQGYCHPVRQKKANDFGLHDMHGNVREWCSDWFSDYRSDQQVDPVGPGKGTHRVFRGGCWNEPAGDCRSAFRDYFPPFDRNYFLGFRLLAVERKK